MRCLYSSACCAVVTGGFRLGMMMARPNWAAVCGTTVCSAAPSRTCRCQSSGRVRIRLSGPRVGMEGAEVLMPPFSHQPRSSVLQDLVEKVLGARLAGIGVAKKLGLGTVFQDLAPHIHEDDPVADLARKAHFVGHTHHGH